MKLRCLACAALLFSVACGSDDEQLPIDGAIVIDAAAIDAQVIDAIDALVVDAPIDAPSSVQIISCSGVTPAATVSAADFAFSPGDTTIDVNDVIRVTTSGTHTFTSDDGHFDVTIGADTCARFTAAGSFPYHCAFHPRMTGTITVE